MKTDIKVAGTTFHKVPAAGIDIKREYMENGVPCADTDAILLPEPENAYDHEAVKVMVPLRDRQAFHIGYIPKDHPVKTMVKGVTKASMSIKDYAQVSNINASFVITEVEGLENVITGCNP